MHYIHNKDPYSEEMIRYLKKVPKCPGTCFFMDINKSTDMKYLGGIGDWGRKLNNTFNYLIYTNHFEKYVVKGIGDEVMMYIPDEELLSRIANNTYFSLLEDIYSSIFNIKNHPDNEIFLDCKVSIHYCREVYNITFFEGKNDYYGSDIDLTARLMTKCIDNRIVMSEKFLIKVKNDMVTLGQSENAGCIRNVSEKFLENFKGVPVSTEYRYIDVLNL